MKISFVQVAAKTRNNNGYGYAREMCEKSLDALGHEVVFLDPTADVEINFIQPQNALWSGCDYRIMYTPWESTGFPDDWIKVFNEVDEVWTPSPIVAQWMIDAGVKKEVHVYQHGVDDIWYKNPRTKNGTFKVIHHGAEALRKGGNDSIKAFMDTLWDEDAQLILKMVLNQFNLHDTKHIAIMNKKIPVLDLVQVYQKSHLMVYPSWGEGFGFAPLQALATAMPTLLTDGWAPYQHLIPESWLIKSTMTDSPWPNIHPGQMFKPDTQDLRDKIIEVYDNYEEHAKMAADVSDAIRAEYDWIELTKKAFAHLV